MCDHASASVRLCQRKAQPRIVGKVELGQEIFDVAVRRDAANVRVEVARGDLQPVTLGKGRVQVTVTVKSSAS